MKTVTIKMSRDEALKLGLLLCECGWPPNSHFDFGAKKCAHNLLCNGYKEKARAGKIVKRKKKS